MYNPQDWNRYAYARYNPLKYTDPSGHDPWWCDGKTASCDEKYLPDITGTRGGHFRSFDGGWNEYRYSTWNLLRNGAPCSACHVTHWTGTIPTNDEISLTQVQGWRSLDQYTLFVHYAGLESTAFYVSQAISAADPSSYIPKGSQQEVSDAFGSWQVERTSEPRSIYRYTSAGAEKPGFYATTDPTMSSTEARSLLALPNANTATSVTQWVIPENSTIISGTVAGQTLTPGFGSYATGGGFQIYVLDPNALIGVPLLPAP